MGDVLFYHLTTQPLERSLPHLLAKSLEREWNVVVRAASDAQVGGLDDMLWTYDDISFLPHGRSGDAHAGQQPIYLTSGEENPARASVLILVEGARMNCDEVSSFERICLMFNGNEPDALDAARSDWLQVKERGLKADYWAQESGSWVQKASTAS